MKSIYEQLELLVREQQRVIKEQQKIIEEQRLTIVRLEARIVKLEEQLNLNSKNSSKPPSSDQKSNRNGPKGGAKPGHKGHYRTLLPLEKVSQTIISKISKCHHCGSTNLRKRASWIFQQVDLPEVKPIKQQLFCKFYYSSSFLPRSIV